MYRQHGDRLWRALLLYSGDPEIASDAVSEAFTQALGREGSLRSPLAWVWRAGFRIAAGELQRRRRRRADSPESSYTMPEPFLDVLAALAKLSPKQRGAVVLHHYAGYSLAEVAAILGSTRAAVGVHLHRGRSRLRTLLEVGDD